jgi:hypothetical protein
MFKPQAVQDVSEAVPHQHIRNLSLTVEASAHEPKDGSPRGELSSLVSCDGGSPHSPSAVESPPTSPEGDVARPGVRGRNVGGELPLELLPPVRILAYPATGRRSTGITPIGTVATAADVIAAPGSAPATGAEYEHADDDD